MSIRPDVNTYATKRARTEVDNFVLYKADVGDIVPDLTDDTIITQDMLTSPEFYEDFGEDCTLRKCPSCCEYFKRVILTVILAAPIIALVVCIVVTNGLLPLYFVLGNLYVLYLVLMLVYEQYKSSKIFTFAELENKLSSLNFTPPGILLISRFQRESVTRFIHVENYKYFLPNFETIKKIKEENNLQEFKVQLNAFNIVSKQSNRLLSCMANQLYLQLKNTFDFNSYLFMKFLSGFPEQDVILIRKRKSCWFTFFNVIAIILVAPKLLHVLWSQAFEEVLTIPLKCYFHPTPKLSPNSTLVYSYRIGMIKNEYKFSEEINTSEYISDQVDPAHSNFMSMSNMHHGNGNGPEAYHFYSTNTNNNSIMLDVKKVENDPTPVYEEPSQPKCDPPPYEEHNV